MSDDLFLPRAEPTIAERPAPAWAKKSLPKSKAAVRTKTKVSARKYFAPNDPHEHAHKIAEGVIDAWHQNFGGTSIDIPIGTVAALALLRNPPAWPTGYSTSSRINSRSSSRRSTSATGSSGPT